MTNALIGSQIATNLPAMSCAAQLIHVARQTSQLQKMPSTKHWPNEWCVCLRWCWCCLVVNGKRVGAVVSACKRMGKRQHTDTPAATLCCPQTKRNATQRDTNPRRTFLPARISANASLRSKLPAATMRPTKSAAPTKLPTQLTAHTRRHVQPLTRRSHHAAAMYAQRLVKSSPPHTTMNVNPVGKPTAPKSSEKRPGRSL